VQYNIKEYAVNDLNNRNHLTDKIDEIIEQNKTDQLYQSYFDHSPEIIEHWRTTFNRNGNNTITGYNGAVSITDVIIDIDLQPGETDLEIARGRASKVLDSLNKDYGVNLIYVYPNFSGSKGFHIRMPAALFGDFEPSEDLPDIVREICKEISGDVSIDESVFKTTGLMRVPNTPNSKSGLYAIPLTAVEITNLNISTILTKAKLPTTPHTYATNIPEVLKLVALKEAVINKINQVPSKNKKSRASTKSLKPLQAIFNRQDKVRLANNGGTMRISDITIKTPIFCPFCDHSKRSHPSIANAFVDLNDEEEYYIYCSSEHKTYWEEQQGGKGLFTRGDNQYYKMRRVGNTYVETMLASFILDPKERLLYDKGGDVTICDVYANSGAVYPDRHITNTDWYSKVKFLTAIGYSDCVFLGSDNEVLGLSNYLMKRVPIIKKGSKVIGLVEDLWVMTDRNFDKNGELASPRIIPSEKGAEAFHNKIEYPVIPKKEMDDMFDKFYSLIMNINDINTIAPFVFWSFIAPLKARILGEKLMDGFPHLFVHGNQGGGKTSTAMLFMRMYGYNISGVFSCTMNPFPMLKLMTATNGTPIVLDEFKKSDLTQFQVDQVQRMMRRSYSNEIESKGKADQSTVDYQLSAPMIVMGEWDIAQPAIRERILLSNFTGAVKNSQQMQLDFEKLRLLPLESFMNAYIPFALGVDIKTMVLDSINHIILNYPQAQPRLRKNLAILHSGYKLFNEFATFNNIVPPKIDIDAIILSQISDITDTISGVVKSSLDQLLEGIAIMASGGNGIAENYDYKVVADRKSGVKGLAINFKSIFPEFKEWARRTQYDIEFLDPKSYKKLFKETDYVISMDKIVKYFNESVARSLFIDIDKALKAGLDLEGFIGVALSDEDKQEIEDDDNTDV
jgi:hypothetical protein